MSYCWSKAELESTASMPRKGNGHNSMPTILMMLYQNLPYNYVTEALESFKEIAFDFSDTVLQRKPDELSEREVARLQAPLGVPLSDEEDEVAEIQKKRKRTAIPITDRTLRSAKRSVPSYLAQNDNAYLTFFHETFANKVTVGKALNSEDSDQWIKAMRAELELLLEHTLEPVSAASMPQIRKVIHSTMQLKLKMLQNGKVDKYKARLCACGNELWSNTAETYSPTIGALAYATVHQIAIIDRMKMCTVDTVGAYLYADYPDNSLPIYLTLPINIWPSSTRHL